MRELEFKPYSTDDIIQILRDRCIRCIRPDSYDRQTLSIIAKSCNGDARIAFQSLRISATEAEVNGKLKIGIEELKVAIKAARRFRSSCVLGTLSELQKMLFDILKVQGLIESGKLFEYCKRSGSKQTDRTYRNNVQRLIELGLAKSEGSGRWKVYEPYA